MATRLTFHGGAGTVTGSCYQIEQGRGRFLIDCGMFQGTKTGARAELWHLSPRA
jgi:metallo-beta-lactamase family protein